MLPLLAVLIVAGVLIARTAMAGESSGNTLGQATANVIGNSIFIILNNVVMWMTKMFASLTGIFISLLVVVAQYNTFLNAPVVQQGWPIVRDLMNMAFIIALLIISAGTVLRLQNYRYNRLLGKLIIMALLVNFSKFIAVFLLQFAQVVMLTFVNAFRDIAMGNFSSMFGLDAVLNFSNEKIAEGIASTSAQTTAGVFITLVAGLAMMIIAFVVMLAITVVLFVRIVALWLLIVLSPIAYALRILPNTEKYASQWWSEFGKYVVVGPVLAFFLWISLALVSNISSCSSATSATDTTDCVSTPLSGDKQTSAALEQANTDTKPLRESFVSEILTMNRMMSFIVGIIFLMFGLNYAQKSGGAGGAWAGRVAEKGFSAGRTLTGLNAIRDRTIAPIQGYLKERQKRNQAEVSRRTTGFTKLADQVESRTIGTAGRATRAAIEGAGSGAKQVIAQTGGLAGKAVSGSVRLARGQITREEALRGAKRAIRKAGGEIIGQHGIAGGAAMGFRQGSEGERVRRSEIQKAKNAKLRFEDEIGRYGDMSPEARRLVMEHGSEAERYAAGVVAMEKGEIDPEKRPEDKALAEGIGKTILGMVNSAEEFNKAVDGLSRKAREAMFGGMQAGYFQGGKRDILAQAGFIDEAFTKRTLPLIGRREMNQQAADDFIGRNEKKMAALLEKSFLSLATLGNKSSLRKINGLYTVDDETVIKGTKDKQFAEAYNATMHQVMDDIYTKHNSLGVKGKNNDLNTDEGKEHERQSRYRALGARGADDSLKDAYRNLEDPAEKANAERFVRTEGKYLDKLNYETLKTSAPDMAELVLENMSRGALRTIFEKVPKTVEDILRDIRDKVDDTTLHIDVRKAYAAKINATVRDEILGGLQDYIDIDSLKP